MLPVAFGGRRGEIMVFLIKGRTPFLFPRPLMEELKLTVDFGNKRMKWDTGPWFPVVQKHKGH